MLALESLRAAMIRLLGTEQWSAEQLAAGLTNRTWAVTVQNASAPSLVVQALLDDEAAAGVGISRELQFGAAELASSLGIAPRLLERYDDLGVVVSEFFPGVMFGESGERRTDAIRGVARALRLLHAAPAEPRFASSSTAPMEGTEVLRKRAEAGNPARYAEFAWAMAPIDEITRRYAAERLLEPQRLCLTHNDLISGNILVGGPAQGVRLIDWEYAGLGDPYSDLGDFAGKCELEPGEELLLLAEYADGYSASMHAWLRVYRYINIVREALWGLAMTGLGLAEINYDAYTRLRFAQVGEYLGTPEFTWALDTLAGTPATVSLNID
jgi:thiamine kinase-like enzyme